MARIAAEGSANLIAVHLGEVRGDRPNAAHRLVGLEALAHALELAPIPRGLKHVVQQADADLDVDRFRAGDIARKDLLRKVRFQRDGSAEPDDVDGTMVLSKEQMARMMAAAKKQAPVAAPSAKIPASAPADATSSDLPFGLLIIGGVILLIIATVITFFVL